VGREGPGDPLGRLVVAGHVVQHDHAGGGTAAGRVGEVGLDLVAVVARDPHRLGHRLAVDRPVGHPSVLLVARTMAHSLPEVQVCFK
jgi:hypothetical protein